MLLIFDIQLAALDSHSTNDCIRIYVHVRIDIASIQGLAIYIYACVRTTSTYIINFMIDISTRIRTYT